MSKGIIWLPIALGIILLVEILVFSIGFTKVTMFAREVQDSNIVFEGDELETYARSISTSSNAGRCAKWSASRGAVPTISAIKSSSRGFENKSANTCTPDGKPLKNLSKRVNAMSGFAVLPSAASSNGISAVSFSRAFSLRVARMRP